MNTIIGILIGSIVTLAVSRHYYLRTKGKIAAYISSTSRILEDLPPELKGDLEINYKKQAIADPFHIILVVKNVGDMPVGRCVAPLTLTLPDSVRLLGAEIVDRFPEDIEVAAEAPGASNTVAFPFNLLNGGEWFKAKLLFDGFIELNGKFLTLRSPGMPPKIPFTEEPVGGNPGAPPIEELIFLGLAISFIVSLVWVISNAPAPRYIGEVLFPDWGGYAQIGFGLTAYLGSVVGLVLVVFILFYFVKSVCSTIYWAARNVWNAFFCAKDA